MSDWEVLDPKAEVLTKQASPSPSSDWEVMPAASTPVSQDSGYKPIIDSSGMAFLQSFLDAAMPFTRYADALARKNEDPTKPMSMRQALDAANQDAEERRGKNPSASTFGTVVGIGAGGLLTGLAGEAFSATASPIIRQGLAKVTAEETANAAARGISELAGLSLEGGLYSVLHDQPASYSEALDSFSKGAAIAGALGLAGKGVITAAKGVKNVVGKVDERLTASAKAKQAVEIEQAQKGAKLKETQVTRQEDLLSRQQNELDLTRAHKDRVLALVEQEPFVNQRLADLPKKIDLMLDTSLKKYGSKKSEIISQIGEQRVDPTKNFKEALTSLESVSTPTPGAEASKNTALKFIKDLDQRLFDDLSATDSLVGIRSTRDTNIASLDKMHDQVQELLYDRGFLEGAPRGSQIRKTVERFERNLRDQINSADPTGQLAVYNEAYHTLKNAKNLDSLSLDNPRFFMQKAVDPNNPALLKRFDDFEAHLKPQSEGGSFRAPKDVIPNPKISTTIDEEKTSDFGSKLATAIYGKREQHATNHNKLAQNVYNEVAQDFKTVRDLIRAESEPVMERYRILQEVKPQIPSLENKIISLENSLESRRSTLENTKLSAENAKIRVEDKKAESPQNSLELLFPAKLRAALKFKRSVDENGELVNKAKQAIQESLPAIAVQSFGRGAVTRLPAMGGFTRPAGSLNELTPDNSIIGQRPLKPIE